MKAIQILTLLVTCVPPAMAETSESSEAAFERTEKRSKCAHYTPTRQPLFGQLHLHTQYSLDAATLQTRNTPRDAYAFARGEKIGLAPFFDTRLVRTSDDEPPLDGVAEHPYCLPPERCQYTAMRTVQLPEGRELDFAAVTDHSEFLGETNICFFEGGTACDSDENCRQGEVCQTGACVPQGYNSQACTLIRDDVSRLDTGQGAALFIAAGWNAEFPQHLPFCSDSQVTVGKGEEDTCIYQAKNAWQRIIGAAEEAYDTTDQCSFTSLIGYEYTSMPAMNQCMASGSPCFANADCAAGDTCANLGQCGAPEEGKSCFLYGTPGKQQQKGCEQAECVSIGGGNNLHRNIIFRNANVPERPISYIDAPTGCGAGQRCLEFEDGAYSTRGRMKNGADGISLASPSAMLRVVEAQCDPNGPNGGCDFLSIPHNSNLSGGAMFVMPENLNDAKIRAEHERLVEIFQIKGGSECRYSAKYPKGWQPGAFAADELCDFENMSFEGLTGTYLVDPNPQSIQASGYVRNALKAGIQYQKEQGVNPFELGFIGSLDNHNGSPTASEVDYSKFGAHGDVSFATDGQMMNEIFFLGLQTNGGGLAVTWAEENSRDSIFAALQRRETYATSGTRPIVRFFGGSELPEDLCQKGSFALQGYRHGVPMGGTLEAQSVSRSPRFAVSALMDTGWVGHPGATLQRAQIVKGWVDENGDVHEKVFDVAGDTKAMPVDLSTCAPAGPDAGGYAQLCEVWEDPEFDASQHAFYYARVLENPSCRWNQYYCLDRQVDCTKRPETANDVVGYNDFDYQQCCSNEVPKAVQQRAWTSPIWYVP